MPATDRQPYTHRVIIERLDTGHVTDRKVRHDVARATYELVRDAEADQAPISTKYRWAVDILLDLEVRELYPDDVDALEHARRYLEDVIADGIQVYGGAR